MSTPSRRGEVGAGAGGAARERRAQLRAAVKDALDLLEASGVGGPELMLRDGRRVRRWRVPPLVLFCVRETKGVLVVRVRHGARRPITRR